MMEELLFQRFLTLTDGKKLDYLYTYLVEDDFKKLTSKYGPESLHVLIENDIVIITSKKLKSARNIKDSMFMDGMILRNEYYKKVDNQYIVTYEFEGAVAPICLT